MDRTPLSINITKVGARLSLGILGGTALLMMFVVAAQAAGLSSFKVASSNMEPSLGAGALAIVKSVDPGRLRVGDSVVYRSSSSLIAQRVVGIVEGADHRVFVLKGDADQTLDSSRLLDEEIVGQIAFSVPRAGFAVDFNRSFPGALLQMLVPATILLLIWARKPGAGRVRVSQLIGRPWAAIVR